jgi:ABC-2 type transport system permease protein
MLTILFQSFVRSTGVKIGLGFLLAAGLVSLLVGRQFLDRQQRNSREVIAAQRTDLQRHVQFHPDEIGLLLYYAQFALVNETPSLVGLSIGQRDVNPAIQRVTIRGLEAQKYDADLSNPTNLLLGNIDFSFVLIYLFPLLIISFTYSAVSEERENGTWRIVAIQSRNLLGFITQLFAVRLAVVLGMLLLLLGLAVVVLGLPLDAPFFLFAGTSALYVLVWFSICFWVAFLHLNSGTNAVLLITFWLVLLLVVPAGLNQYILSRYPLPEALATTVKQRKGYHDKWDQPQESTMVKFYARYPQFKHISVPNTSFSWLWYYAMQQMGDEESAREAGELRQKLQGRETASHQLGLLIPTLHAQLQLNDLARSGLGNQVRFLDETTRFHERLRLYFYPKIFSDYPAKEERWDRHRVERFSDRTPIPVSKVLLPPFFFVLLFGGMGWLNFRRNLYQL